MINRIQRIKDLKKCKRDKTPLSSSSSESDEEGMNYNPGKYMKVDIGSKLCGGKYTVLSKLGYGHFASVWEVEDNKKCKFACKVQKSRKDYKESAEGEIKVLKKLEEEKSNDQITSLLHDFIENRNGSKHICMVFDKMDTDLDSLIDKTEFLSTGESLEIVYNIAKGLKHIHDHKYIHTDIKPENILMSQVDEVLCLKIADFGTATPFDEKDEWTYIQTLPYRAPEVIVGSAYSYNIDVWSTGCLLFECVTGDELFDGDEELDVICAMVETLGKFPQCAIEGTEKKKFFDRKGRVRSADLEPWPLRRVLIEKYNFNQADCDMLTAFMHKLLDYDKKRRISSTDMLEEISRIRILREYS